MKRFLFYISQNYSFEILRPLQIEILQKGYDAAWFVESKDIDLSLFTERERRLESIEDVLEYNPDAVFVPGNVVPGFIPGIKVQVFHGFEWKKKGHFRIRGFFDLYCTQGPLFTHRFEELAASHRHFKVVETGWPKSDVLFNADKFEWEAKDERPVVLYAPTFSPSLTSAPHLFETISDLANSGKWQWIVKFHPKMAVEWVEKYQQIQSDNLRVVSVSTIGSLLQAGDVLLSDTSSIITEFAMLNKPVVTFCNSQPESHLLDFRDSRLLEEYLTRAFIGNDQLKELINDNVAQLHPFNDGKSSGRVLDATLDMIDNGRVGLRDKPRNLLRQFKLRKKLKHWKF